MSSLSQNQIFMSYAHQDRDRVRVLVAALEAEGYRVFWDRTIPPGVSWRQHIGARLLASPVVVVVWSKYSVESNWVLEEADSASKRGALIPVMIDAVHPPLGLGHVQAADLTWISKRGRVLPAELKSAISDKLRVGKLESASGRQLPSGPAEMEAQSSHWEPPLESMSLPTKGLDQRHNLRLRLGIPSVVALGVAIFVAAMLYWGASPVGPTQTGVGPTQTREGTSVGLSSDAKVASSKEELEHGKELAERANSSPDANKAKAIKSTDETRSGSDSERPSDQASSSSVEQTQPASSLQDVRKFGQLSLGLYAIPWNVSDGYQNIRSGPGQKHSVIAKIPAGTNGVELGPCRPPDDGQSRYDWCQASWNGYQGWISSCCLNKQVAPGVYSIPANVSDGYQNIRSGPGLQHAIVAKIQAGTGGVEIGSCRSPDDGQSHYDWCEANWNGNTGWISSCCLNEQVAPGVYSIPANLAEGYQNIRSGPGQQHAVIAKVPAGSGGVEIGPCRPPDDGQSRYDWCQASWNGSQGWISSCCLAKNSERLSPSKSSPRASSPK
jgi:uncharacterized protein YraI